MGAGAEGGGASMGAAGVNLVNNAMSSTSSEESLAGSSVSSSAGRRLRACEDTACSLRPPVLTGEVLPRVTVELIIGLDIVDWRWESLAASVKDLVDDSSS
jgi:hypothetical protein